MMRLRTVAARCAVALLVIARVVRGQGGPGPDAADDPDERWCAPPSARVAAPAPDSGRVAPLTRDDAFCLTPSERLRLLARQTIDPIFHAQVLLSAGWGQLTRDPAAWPRDRRGFGRRVEVEVVTWATYTSVEALVAGVLDVDPRPTFAPLAAGRPSLGTALLNGTTLRRRDGARVFALPGVVGAAASGWTFWALRPEGARPGRIAIDAATSFAIATVTHVAVEYWRWWRRPGRGAGGGASPPPASS